MMKLALGSDPPKGSAGMQERTYREKCSLRTSLFAAAALFAAASHAFTRGGAPSAQFITQSVPSSLNTGASARVSVTVRNSGTVSWSGAQGYFLGSQTGNTWGVTQVNLRSGETIAAGQSKTFFFTITAPSSAGSYNFQWRMRANATAFGAASTLTVIPVGGAPPHPPPPSGGQWPPPQSHPPPPPPPPPPPVSTTVWPQFNFDSQHSGNNTLETALTRVNVSGLTKLYQATLPSVADGAPAFLPGVSTPTGTKDLLFLTTKAGHLLALDAHTGAQVWSHQYGPGTCKINSGSTTCYTTSSPAIDPNQLYVYGYGLDGAVHKFRVSDGTETIGGGWPETTTLKGFDEKGSSALTVATAGAITYLYVTNGGYPGDGGDYQGHVTAIKLSDGTQKVFNANCSDQAVHFVHSPGTPDCYQPSSTSTLVQSAIWAREGVVYEPHLNRIFMATGNGPFDAGNVSTPNHDWGDSVFALSPDASGSNGRPLDSYTPTNSQQLDTADADLGSTAPAILPSSFSGGILGAQSGKDAKLRLLNLSNLSGQGGPGNVGGELQLLSLPNVAGVLTAPAVWVNPTDISTWCFIANGAGISAFKLVFDGSGIPSLANQWSKSPGGTSPILANGVLYVTAGGNLRAMNPETGAVLWTNVQIGGIHWESPVVVNGMLFLTDESSNLTAFTLP
jgi:Ig-like domain from next to BRCA1 gene/PQQ-like domain